MTAEQEQSITAQPTKESAKYLVKQFTYQKCDRMSSSGWPIISTNVTTEKKRIVCYVVSDLHSESLQNTNWIKHKVVRKPHESDACFTILILPGDVATALKTLERVFLHVREQYDLVCYTPGNHEAWSSDKNVDSVAKLKQVLVLAKGLGIKIGPVRIKAPSRSVIICPLFSWYHTDFDSPTITEGLVTSIFGYGDNGFEKQWGDFHFCRWPSSLISHEEFASITTNSMKLPEYFAALNEPFLPQSQKDRQAADVKILGTPDFDSGNDDVGKSASNRLVISSNDTVISFSHFLPRPECSSYSWQPAVRKVSGSRLLESQLRRLGSHLHLFGHTHFPIFKRIDGVIYRQWPLGYFKEARYQCKEVFESGPLLVYDSNLGVAAEGIVVA